MNTLIKLARFFSLYVWGLIIAIILIIIAPIQGWLWLNWIAIPLLFYGIMGFLFHTSGTQNNNTEPDDNESKRDSTPNKGEKKDSEHLKNLSSFLTPGVVKFLFILLGILLLYTSPYWSESFFGNSGLGIRRGASSFWDGITNSVDPETLTISQGSVTTLSNGYKITLKPGEKSEVIHIPLDDKPTTWWNTSTIFLNPVGGTDVIKKPSFVEEKGKKKVPIPGGDFQIFHKGKDPVTFKVTW